MTESKAMLGSTLKFGCTEEESRKEISKLFNFPATATSCHEANVCLEFPVVGYLNYSLSFPWTMKICSDWKSK